MFWELAYFLFVFCLLCLCLSSLRKKPRGLLSSLRQLQGFVAMLVIVFGNFVSLMLDLHPLYEEDKCILCEDECCH